MNADNASTLGHGELMRLFSLLYALLRHLNETQRWDDLINYVGTTNLHVILFAIIFIETGLVVWPFLPGDSLLFAVGTICATSSTMHLPVVAVLLCVAANCGDIVNYCIGYRLGPKVFSKDDPAWSETPAASEVTYAT